MITSIDSFDRLIAMAIRHFIIESPFKLCGNDFASVVDHISRTKSLDHTTTEKVIERIINEDSNQFSATDLLRIFKASKYIPVMQTELRDSAVSHLVKCTRDSEDSMIKLIKIVDESGLLSDRILQFVS